MGNRNRDPERALDAVYDAASQLSDDELAARADVTVRQVQIWKKKRGLSDKSALQESIGALRGLTDYEPKAHVTTEHLDWETPTFLLRVPLDYTQYARACFALQTTVSFTLKQIAHATGTKPRDVELAIEIWRRHLTARGKRCLGCATLLDHRFTEFCSRSCHDYATKP